MFPVFSNYQHLESESLGMAEVERVDVHREPLVLQFVPISSDPGNHWKEPGSIFAPSLSIFWELIRFPYSFSSPD